MLVYISHCVRDGLTGPTWKGQHLSVCGLVFHSTISFEVGGNECNSLFAVGNVRCECTGTVYKV